MSSTRNKAPSSLTEVVGAAVLLVALPEALAAGTQCSEVSTSEVPGMPCAEVAAGLPSAPSEVVVAGLPSMEVLLAGRTDVPHDAGVTVT